MHKKSDKVVKGGKVMDEFKDETLSCRDCSEDFVFTEGEQEFYNSKGWENKPTRCEACKNAKKARFGEDKPKCYAYERGECSRGDQCKFSHGTEKTFGGGGGAFVGAPKISGPPRSSSLGSPWATLSTNPYARA